MILVGYVIFDKFGFRNFVTTKPKFSDEDMNEIEFIIEPCYISNMSKAKNLVFDMHGSLTMRLNPKLNGNVKQLDWKIDPGHPNRNVVCFVDIPKLRLRYYVLNNTDHHVVGADPNYTIQVLFEISTVHYQDGFKTPEEAMKSAQEDFDNRINEHIGVIV